MKPPTIFIFLLLTNSAVTYAKDKANLIDVRQTVQKLSQSAPTLKIEVLQRALRAYNQSLKDGHAQKPVLTVIDYNLPSTEKRLWVINLKDCSIPYHTYVAHGRNSGDLRATKFSNKPNSLQTSLGTFVTENPYVGKQGYSLKIKGLEHGINHNAAKRAVVVHGARYANEDFLKKAKRLGRSWGCQAIPTKLAKPIINHIKQGGILYADYPDADYFKASKFV